jgi:hypothetical protein
MKRQQSAKDKELADREKLLKAWRKFHREELNTALAGPHGPMLERLVYILKSLAPDSASLLLAYVRGVDWSAVDANVRLVVLHETNAAVTRMRERLDPEKPIDDGIPDIDRDNVFRVIRTLITSSSRPAGAAPEPIPVDEAQRKEKEFEHVE